MIDGAISGRQRQEDYQKFEANLMYEREFHPARATQ